MKKIRLLVATIAMIMVSTVAFGQTVHPTSIVIQDYPTLEETISSINVRVEWYGSNGGMYYSETITYVDDLGNGIMINMPTVNERSFFPVVEMHIIITYSREIHYGVYKGHPVLASRILHPQYWVVVPK